MSSENLFMFLNDAQSFQNLACFEFGLELWRQYCPVGYLMDLPSIDLSSKFDLKLRDINSEIFNLPLPNDIQEMLAECVDWIKLEIDLWLEFNDHHYEISPVFFRPFVLYTGFDELIWNYDDLTINHEKSAKTMIQNSRHRLDPSQIFVVACSYCFVQQISEFRYTQEQNLQIRSSNLFQEDILEYWINPDRFDDNFDNRTVSLFCFTPIRNTSTYYYFWYSFSEESQVDLILYYIRHENFDRLKYVLGTLSQHQWARVVQNDGVSLMQRLLQGNVTDEHVLQVWNYVNEMFDENQFIELMRFDLPSRVNCCNPYNDCVHKLLWISASDKLRRNTVGRLLGELGFLRIY